MADALANVIAVFPSTDLARWIVARLFYRLFLGAFVIWCGLLSRHRRFGCFDGFCGSRGSGLSKANSWLPAVRESTPATSKARCSASIVRSFNSSPRSNLATVSIELWPLLRALERPNQRCTGHPTLNGQQNHINAPISVENMIS